VRGVGGLRGVGLTLGDGFRARAAGADSGQGRARSVILIFNCGAPSHIDLWDPKPDAPDDIRGPFKPIATNVPGIQVSELLPELAKRADRYALVRTVNHGHNQHNSGMYWSIVGRPYREDSTLINPTRGDYPSFGTLAGWLAQQHGYDRALPPYVITPAPHCDSTVYITPGQYGGFLGSRYDPFVLNGDPNSPRFTVPNLAPVVGDARLERRRGLLARLDGGLRGAAEADPRALDAAQEKAFSLVTSPEVRRAFDLSQEPV